MATEPDREPWPSCHSSSHARLRSIKTLGRERGSGCGDDDEDDCGRGLAAACMGERYDAPGDDEEGEIMRFESPKTMNVARAHRYFAEYGDSESRATRRRRGRNGTTTARTKLALSLLIFALVHQPVLFIAADPSVEYGDAVKDADFDARVDRDEYIQRDLTIPASLIKATRVGAKMREGGRSGDDDEEEEGDEDEEGDEAPPGAKPPLAGCHWGAMGCKKGKWRPGSGSGAAANASSTEDPPPPRGEEQDAVLVAQSPSSSSLAGSATAKIKARVRPAAGPSPPPVYDRDIVVDSNNASAGPSKKEAHETTTTGQHMPPRGFKLTGRVVTSPSDGLSYFLDGPAETADDEYDWSMTVPYAYLECGPTIESTTEAFSLGSMVLRHFPASASVGHWTNLGGGVTIEGKESEEGGKGGGRGDGEEGSRYIEGGGEGNPKLVVALSPVEITVSGNGEESRIFEPGEVILMEDALGKGHKMKSARGRGDLRVMMVSLPHAVHFPTNDWLDDGASRWNKSDDDGGDDPASARRSHASSVTSASSARQTSSYDAHHALYGFAPRHLHHKNREMRKRSSSFATAAKKPCPLEYDSAYSSLFTPSSHHHHRKRQRLNRGRPRHWGAPHSSRDSSFDNESYPPPPGFSTYDRGEGGVFDYFPSLRRTMLFGLGLSLSSSFIYCVQLLYPPLLVLWGGATVVAAGALLNVMATRWGYRNWVADRAEEWRWRREVRRMRRPGEGSRGQKVGNDDTKEEDVAAADDILKTHGGIDEEEDENDQLSDGMMPDIMTEAAKASVAV